MASNKRISNQSPDLDFHSEYSEYDELSFCDLPMDHNIDETEELKPQNTSPTSEDDQDLFEFSTSPQNKPAVDQATVFCGKPMGAAKQPGELLRHLRKGRLIRKESFKKCKSDVVSSKTTLPTSPCGVCVRGSNRSSSFRFGGGGKNKEVSSSRTGNSWYSRSGNGGSRKQKVIIGLVKLQPEMELSEIRKRQGRRSPVPMFPATGGTGEEDAGGRNPWGILRPLRYRTHFVSALTKASFGCRSHA